MDATTILVRFMIGVTLAGGLALWGGVPSPWGLTLAVSVGVAAAAWGDKFFLGFMSVVRHFR